MSFTCLRIDPLDRSDFRCNLEHMAPRWPNWPSAIRLVPETGLRANWLHVTSACGSISCVIEKPSPRPVVAFGQPGRPPFEFAIDLWAWQIARGAFGSQCGRDLIPTAAFLIGLSRNRSPISLWQVPLVSTTQKGVLKALRGRRGGFEIFSCLSPTPSRR